MSKNLRKLTSRGLRLGLTLLLGSGMATAFAAIIPGPGDVPDMFGIYPNYANSPLPMGICYPNGYQPGSGTAFLTKGNPTGSPGGGTPQGCTSDVTCLAYFPGWDESLTSPSGVNDPTNDPVCSGWVGGIRKFVDSLPGVSGLQGINAPNNLKQVITVLKPDPVIGVTQPSGVGSAPFDYYEIAFVEFEEKMHSDLPPIKLRGYVQLATPTNPPIADPGGGTWTTYSVTRGGRTFTYLTKPHYAPLIVAETDKPVRIRFVNLLPSSTSTTKGAIGLPVDKTYMGGGAGPVDSKGNSCDPNAKTNCAIYPENRAVVHFHGGTTPWISDGTPFQTITPVDETATQAALATGPSKQDVPDMWYDSKNNYNPIAACMGLPACAVANATTNPGQGANTFFWTNQQSARLMFWHDHALGMTRLNVYKGMAGGYLLTDPTIEARDLYSIGVPTLDPRGTYNLNTAHILPLVIQEKAFVPSNAGPIGFNPANPTSPGTPTSPLPYAAKFTNLVGEFPSQLQAQDPTWDTTKWGGPSQLWWPHVYMPNQNPSDPTGVNAMGRWDYGPWMAVFGLPAIQKKDQPNPYYDATCVPNAVVSCEPKLMTATPDAIALGSNPTKGIPGKSWSPSGTPEVMLDTPVINGTAYPRLDVEAGLYRFHILNATNDRFLNLSWFVAAQNDRPNTWLDDGTATVPALRCDANTSSWVREKCTEVRMVPFNSTQNQKSPFPLHWYTVVPNGSVFDDRWGGVPDPITRGPAWVQIGNEGGLLPKPAVIKNQPVNYDYNKKSGTFGNVKEKALFMGPAERADVIVDFSPFAGSCLILYNDAPAPGPAADPRYDYFTGNADTTDVGGAPTTLPGMGPNIRTLMQVCVTGSGGAGTPDYVNNGLLTALTTKLPQTFHDVQEPIIVPQVAYNAVAPWGPYPLVSSDIPGVNIARDADIKLGPFTPWEGVTQTAVFDPALPFNGTYQFKALIEGFQQDYGRMNTNLGTQLAPTQVLPGVLGGTLQRFTDPPVDTVALTPYNTQQGPVALNGAPPDGTQLWHLVHLGVDTHPIHFHMFHVQVVNRGDITGAITMPDPNELGWKDTVRMNPLEDVTVALRPRTLSLPFEIGNSWRLIDPTRPKGVTGGMFTTLGPLGANPIPATISNDMVNFGWEYVWHCHILGHEEDDMMHAIPIANPPPKPTNLTATPSNLGTTSGTIALAWKDNSMNETEFVIQKATNIRFNPLASTFIVTRPVPTATSPNTAGGTVTYPDNIGTAAGPIYYRVIARNTVGATSGWAVTDGYPTKSADSEPSNIAGLLPPAPEAPTLTSPPTATRPLAKTGLTQLTFYFNDNSMYEDQFRVQRCSDPSGNLVTNCTWQDLATVLGSTTTGERSYVDNTVAMGHSYAYRVLAENLSGQSAWAEMTTALLVPVPPPAAPTLTTSTAPPRPLELSLTPLQLTFYFNDKSTNEDNFLVQRCTATSTSVTGCVWTDMGTLPGSAANTTGEKSYVDNSVAMNSFYGYRVAASNTGGQSAWAQMTSALQVKGTLPTAPTNASLARTSATAAGLTLTFSDNSNNESSFDIERSWSSDGTTWTTETPFLSLASTGTAITGTGSRTYADTAVTEGRYYRYRVRASNTFGQSAWVGPTTAIIAPAPLGVPTSVKVTCPTSTSCTLTWTDNAYAEGGFQCQKTSPTPTASVQVGANITSCTFSTGLKTKTSYQFCVQAFSGTTYGTCSATVKGTTK